VLCAICDEVNEDLILTQDVVNQLFHLFNLNVVSCASVEQVKDRPITVRDHNGVTTDGDGDVHDECERIDNNCDVNEVGDVINLNQCDYIDVETVDQTVCDSSKANVESLIREQLDDKTLSGCFLMAQRGKGNYIVKDGLLFHIEKLFGQFVENLVVPEGRRNHVLKLAHEMCGGHLAMKKTRDRIKISGLTWPTLTSSCKTVHFKLSYLSKES
jgi:hypothetical protein